MSDLLFFNSLVEENFTDLVTYTSIALIVILLIAVGVMLARKKLATQDIAYAGVAISISFVLSFLKVTPVLYGGSITLASLAPLLIYAYYFGFAKALVCGLIYGLLQFIQDPYILTPATFTLDYLLAFASVSVMGLFSKAGLNAKTVTLGTTLSILCRFVMHFISGILYFNHGSIWVNLPANSAVSYSLLYQTVYLIPDLVICLAVMLVLLKTRVLEQIKPRAK
ncbi:MAG: hypothetical protein E7339_04055 [Clostridiales bacterium]|nr:hypothetical protein [Clostridiales bacterium]